MCLGTARGRSTFIDEQAVLDDIPRAEAIVDTAAKVILYLTPFAM
jgi:hypothetical protein